MTGILINGVLHPVDGLTIIPPASHGGPAWASLDVRDYRARKTSWIRQIVNHATWGGWPQIIVPGHGPGGRAERCARIWRSDPAYSGAHMLVEDDVVYQLADIGRVAAHHAEGSNPWSVGIEHCQYDGGHISELTIATGALLNLALCELLGIPEQMPGPYRGRPIERCEFGWRDTRRNTGGPDVVGILGHRDNTRTRGRGDPGDAICEALAAAGVRVLDYDQGEDLEVGRERQRWLVARGERLVIDGVLGPASVAAMRRHARTWRELDAATPSGR